MATDAGSTGSLNVAVTVVATAAPGAFGAGPCRVTVGGFVSTTLRSNTTSTQ